MTKIEAAIKYAARGWRIFPCSANTKIPLGSAAPHGVKDATSDEETVRKWWMENPDANIGLACGEQSGVYVVDIDRRVEQGVDGFESIKASGKKLPRTLMQHTPSGGMHFLYKCEGEKPANKNGFLTGVDIRSTGYYIILTPSTIDGKIYSWEEENSPLAEYPEDFKPAKSESKPVFVAIPPACTTSSLPMADRARAYLAAIPGAVEHVDGHAKLFWAAQVLVNGFRLSDEEALDMMWSEYNPRCIPPWTRNGTTEKEFRHKVAEARKKPNPEACSIYDAVGDYEIEDDIDFDACIENVRAMLAPKTVSSAKSAKVSKVDALTNDLLLPQGLVGDIAKWMNDTAGCYQPLFALGASLAFCGALFGRKVCDESNGRTNIFCMGVGHSSCGKDHPGDCINRILTAAGAQNLLMGRMTSDSAIEKALSLSPTKMCVLDEVGHFFSTINSAGDGSAYLKTIKPTLMELFSSAHKTYIGKEKASGSPPIIDQPCICIWGVTAPQKLYAGMTIEELQDGWIARNLIFISESRPQYIMKPSAEVPDSIVEAVKAWYARSSGGILITANPGGQNRPLLVPMDQDARIVFDRFSAKAHEAMLESNRNGEKTEYLWGKAFQNARRIALIVACGREFESPSIGKYEAEYGCRLVELLVRNAAKSIAANVSENKFENEKIRILHIVQSAGMNGITQNNITRRTQWIRDTKTRMSYLGDLVEAGRIQRIEIETGVGPKAVWMSAEAALDYRMKQGVDHEEAE